MDDFSHVTLCFCTPRSRSQWLVWLYGHAIESWHDPLKYCEQPSDLVGMILNRKRPEARLFIADTSAILFHRALLKSMPGVRALYVIRDTVEIEDSLKRQTMFRYRNQVASLHARMTHYASAAGPRRWRPYDAIESGARVWWDEVTGVDAPPPSFWRDAFSTNIGLPMREQTVFPENRQKLLTHTEKQP